MVLRAAWYDVYNFLEFAPVEYGFATNPMRENYYENANQVLERELSAFRFIDRKLVAISNPTEVAAVTEAIEATTGGRLAAVNQHLRQAISLFSDRKEADYRNVVKEAVSAVESLARIIVDDPAATLGKAVKQLGEQLGLHSAFVRAVGAMYGWVSDDGGIRHGLNEDSTPPDFEEAKLMLVWCSGMTTFLIGKAARAKLKL